MFLRVAARSASVGSVGVAGVHSGDAGQFDSLILPARIRVRRIQHKPVILPGRADGRADDVGDCNSALFDRSVAEAPGGWADELVRQIC